MGEERGEREKMGKEEVEKEEGREEVDEWDKVGEEGVWRRKDAGGGDEVGLGAELEEEDDK